MLPLIIVILTVILLVLAILFFPNLKIKNFSFQIFWLIPLISALILLAIKAVPLDNLIETLTTDTAVNPLKLLALFISMTIISIFLDEIGFFSYVAMKSAKLFNGSQYKLFFGFYAIISLLTIFTSNDIIVLTFTPFICYYAKNVKINPIPYLVSEFVAANTWSIILIIGNPTNIYLASAFEIDFFTYTKNMVLPTIAAGTISLLILTLIFYKQLKTKMEPFEKEIAKPDPFLLTISLVHLLATTVLLAVSSYIDLEMWIISSTFALSLLVIALIYLLIRKKKLNPIKSTLIRAPYNLIPFVLSMFVLVLALNNIGTTAQIRNFLNSLEPTYAYGISGAIVANLINNIPMSVLYSNLLIGSDLKAVYASIIASNIAAFITPIGALAGIMWINLLKSFDVQFRFKNFLGYGLIIGIPTLLGALTVLFLL